jgi:hypothetical protein
MRAHPSRLDLLDAQTDETERENWLAEAATVQRQAAGSWKQARSRTDPEASGQALHEQVSGAVNCDRCTRSPSGSLEGRSHPRAVGKWFLSDPVRDALSAEVQCTHSFGRLREIQFTVLDIRKAREIFRVVYATNLTSVWWLAKPGNSPMSLSCGSGLLRSCSMKKGSAGTDVRISHRRSDGWSNPEGLPRQARR